MTLRKQKAERKQQLVKNVEEMKQELAKVSKNGIEHRKNIFEIWFAFPKMVCFYPSSDLECLHFFFQVWFTKEYLNSKVMSPHKSQYIVQSGIKEEFFFLFKVVLSRTGLCKYILGKKMKNFVWYWTEKSVDFYELIWWEEVTFDFDYSLFNIFSSDKLFKPYIFCSWLFQCCM